MVGGGLDKQHWLLSIGSKDVRRISKTKPRSFLALPSYRRYVLHVFFFMFQGKRSVSKYSVVCRDRILFPFDIYFLLSVFLLNIFHSIYFKRKMLI